MEKELKQDLISLLKELKEDTRKLQTELIFTNGTGEYICVVDIETDRVIFMNNSMKAAFGDRVGELCYLAFQDFHQHCKFCTNDIITKNIGVPYKWMYHNSKINKYFFIVDVCKSYNNRLVRIEKAYEIDIDVIKETSNFKI